MILKIIKERKNIMRAVYIDRYYMTNSHSCVFGCVSLPILKRKEIKQKLNDFSKNIMCFDDIDGDNVKIFYDYCNLFMKDSDMTSNILRIGRFRRKDYPRQLFQLIETEYKLHKKEPMRVYIPFDKNKTFIKTLNAMCRKRKIDVSIEEIKYEESKVSQLTNILCGSVYYHDREDLYGVNLGRKGKPQLIAYIYSCKKNRNKFNIVDFNKKNN